MRVLLISVLCMSCMLGSAQTRIVGRITMDGDTLSGKREALPFASVTLFRVSDSVVVSGANSNENGGFMIDNVKPGSYYLRFSYVGFQTDYRALEVKSDSRMIRIGEIPLKQGLELAAAEIKASHIPVIVKEDTIEFAADAYKAPEGAMVEDLLKRLPGVEVDKDGKITSKGKEVKKILVDGKPFFSDDPKVASKSLPSNMIDKVQLFDKSSDQAAFTKIEDDDSENVINLIVKPGMKKGWFGHVTVSGGNDLPFDQWRYQGTANINYFKGDNQFTLIGGANNVNSSAFSDIMNMVSMGGGMRSMRMGSGGTSFGTGDGVTQTANAGANFNVRLNPKMTLSGNYMYTFTDNESERSRYREDILSSGTTFLNERSSSRTERQEHRINFEWKYDIDSMNSLELRPSVTYGIQDRTTSSLYRTLSLLNDTVNQGLTNNEQSSESMNVGLRAIYRHRFAKPRRTLSLTFDGSLRSANIDALNYSMAAYLGGSQDTVDQTVDNLTASRNWSARATYTEPLAKNWVMELTYMFSYSDDKSRKDAFDLNSRSGLYDLLDSTYSSHYDNYFSNQRAEVRFQYRREKYNLSFGLGIYPSSSRSEIHGIDTLQRNVFNYAPNLNFNYSWSKSRTLRIFYSGRTTQPTIEQLQPVPDNTDPLNISVGNPTLKPEFRHSLRAMYHYFNTKNMSSTIASLSANVTQNKITTITIYDPTAYGQISIADSLLRPGVKILMADNVPYTINANAMFIFSTPIAKSKFNVSTNTNASYSNSRSVIDRSENVLNNFLASENLRLSYRIERFDCGVNGRITYNRATYSLQSERNTNYFDYYVGLDATWTIIPGLQLNSDISYNRKDGYSDGFNPEYTMWNAQLSYSFLKNKQAQVRLRVFDILNKQQNTYRTTGDTYLEDVTYNTLGRYFLVSLVYQLNPSMGGRGSSSRHGMRAF